MKNLNCVKPIVPIYNFLRNKEMLFPQMPPFMTMRVHSDFRICKLKSSVSLHAPLHDDEGAITLHNLQLEVFTSPTFPVTGAVLHPSMTTRVDIADAGMR